MIRLLVLLGLAACARERVASRAEELQRCRLVNATPDGLASCLVLKYDWTAESTLAAKVDYSSYLDSVRREHERQVAALVAEERQQAYLAAAAVWGSWARCLLGYRSGSARSIELGRRFAVVNACESQWRGAPTERQSRATEAQFADYIAGSPLDAAGRAYILTAWLMRTGVED